MQKHSTLNTAEGRYTTWADFEQLCHKPCNKQTRTFMGNIEKRTIKGLRCLIFADIISAPCPVHLQRKPCRWQVGSRNCCIIAYLC